jgi:hypothetical protein
MEMNNIPLKRFSELPSVLIIVEIIAAGVGLFVGDIYRSCSEAGISLMSLLILKRT